jgi:hypothetical protein
VATRDSGRFECHFNDEVLMLPEARYLSSLQGHLGATEWRSSIAQCCEHCEMCVVSLFPPWLVILGKGREALSALSL